MLNTEQIVLFLSGIGLGSILTTVVQHLLSRQGKKYDYRFLERKDAFLGLLVAYTALAEGWSDRRAKQFALWEIRVQLVGSQTTVNALKRLKASDAESEARTRAHDDLVTSMRSDLGVA